jgi:colanic acid biosynthesis protein WcaH
MVFLPDEDYLKCLKSLPIAAADIVILNPKKTKVLLFKRKNEPAKGLFYTPGGRILKNEKNEKAAARKMKEELGLKVDSKKLIFSGVQDEFFSNSAFKATGSHIIDIFFSFILPENIKPTLDFQHSVYKWFRVDSPLMHPYIKRKVKAALRTLP